MKYDELFQEARSCYESGRFGACDVVLAELSSLKLKWLQRREVAGMILDNAYQAGRRDRFLNALQADYVRHNLYRKDYDYWYRLSCIPATETCWPAPSVTLPLQRSGSEGNAPYGIEVVVNGKHLRAVIDNCAADYCDISTDLARELGVRPIGKRIKIDGKRKRRAYVGVADTLEMGGLVLKHVLFSVSSRNEALAATSPFDMIVGADVLRQTGDLIIDNVAGTVTFSRETLNLPQNVYWTYPGHGYYVEGSLGEEEVVMLLDLGCSHTNLNKQYTDSLPAGTQLPESSTRAVMPARSRSDKTYTLPPVRLAFCDTVCVLSEVEIFLKDYGGRGMSGVIGTDVLGRYKTVFFNARQMYLRLISE